MQLLPDKVKQYYDQGKVYLQDGQMEKAIENLQKVIQLQPYFANAYIHLGAAYYALRQHEQAIDHIQKHIQLQPKSAMAYIILGNVYNYIKQHKKAIECYIKAAELQPDNATPHCCMGIIHFQLGDYKKAIDNFKVAIDLQPFTKFTLEPFSSFASSGLEDKLREGFEGRHEKKVSAKIPFASLANIYINMGATYIKLKQYKQAILSCLKAIELAPEGVEAYNNLGVAYASLGQYDSAIEHFKHASKLQPSNVSTHFNMGVILSRLDKYNEAVSHFSKVIYNSCGKRDADDDIQNSPLEVIYVQLKQSGDSIITTSQQVIEIQPDEEAKAHNILGDTYSGEGQYEAAISCYRKVIELQPDNVMAYYNSGKLYFKHQEELQGIECFSKVIELQPDNKISKKALDTILLFNDVRVVKPLISALKSKDKYSRLCSVPRLGEIGDSRAVKPLIELLDDSDEDICQYAAKALIKLKEKAVAPLISALELHENEDIRQYAAYILEQIGTDEALKALEETEKQGVEYVRKLSSLLRKPPKKIKQTAKGTARKKYSRKTTLWSIFSGR